VTNNMFIGVELQHGIVYRFFTKTVHAISVKSRPLLST